MLTIEDVKDDDHDHYLLNDKNDKMTVSISNNSYRREAVESKRNLPPRKVSFIQFYDVILFDYTVQPSDLWDTEITSSNPTREVGYVRVFT